MEIDVDYFAGLLLGVDVEEDAETHGKGARYLHLVSTEKGHISPAHLSGGQGGELGVEVGAAGEEGGGYVFGVKPVGFRHGLEELRSGLKDRLAGVGLDSGGAPDTSSQHADIAEARSRLVGARAGLLAGAKYSGPRAATICTAGRLLANSEKPSDPNGQLSAGR